MSYLKIMRIKRIYSVAYVVICGLGMLMTASFDAKAQTVAPKNEVVRFAALPPSALLWLHAIAVDRGFYSAQNVEVQLLQVSDSPSLVQAVSSGSADAGASLGDLVLRAVDQHAPIVIPGTLQAHTMLRLFGNRNAKRVSDLAGKRVAAGALKGGTTNLLLYQLKRGGVDPKDVQVVAIPNSKDRIVALQGGQIDGSLLIPPFDVTALRSGFPMLDVYREPYIETPLIFNKNWASKNRHAAIGFVHALRSAAEWIYQPANRSDAVRILAKFTNTPTDVANEVYDFVVVQQQVFSRDLRVDPEGLTNILKIDADVNGGPVAPFRLQDYYDPSYLDAK